MELMIWGSGFCLWLHIRIILEMKQNTIFLMCTQSSELPIKRKDIEYM